MPGSLVLDVESGGVRLVVHCNQVLDPRAGVIIAPGFSEYAGRYRRLSQELAARGYSTFSYDPRGHGESSGARGHTPSWGALVKDLDIVIGALESEKLLPRRLGLLGASMGALVALDWTLANRGRVQGLAMVGAFFKSAMSPAPWKIAMAHALGPVLPSLGVATGLKGRDMSTDLVVVSHYDHDPKITRVMTPRYFHEYESAQRRLRKAAPTIDFPVLLLHGAADPIASPEAAAEWAKAAPRAWCEWTVYAGLKHEVLNELDRRRVVSDLMYWLDRRVLEHPNPGP
jgi:alpha-beta hydrolase superfamily lysophospholipase